MTHLYVVTPTVSTGIHSSRHDREVNQKLISSFNIELLGRGQCAGTVAAIHCSSSLLKATGGVVEGIASQTRQDRDRTRRCVQIELSI